MIVPMKKVSLLILGGDRESALTKLRRLGLMQIDVTETSGGRVAELGEKIVRLEATISLLSDRDAAPVESENSTEDALSLADRVASLLEEKQTLLAERALRGSELARLDDWGELDPNELAALSRDGITLTLCETSPGDYASLPEGVTTIKLSRTKSLVRFAFVSLDGEIPEIASRSAVKLPECSTKELKSRLAATEKRLSDIESELDAAAAKSPLLKNALETLRKELEFEALRVGVEGTELAAGESSRIEIVCISGYIPADGLDSLKALARESSWGLTASDPTPDDNAPTELKNNRFVSLIYPLTDFLGTVPGYFEYDISAWFLGFILVFFGIIFGDGGYGLLISAVAGGLVLKARLDKKPIPAAYLLILLMGGATMLWGVLTCTWFGISPEQLPIWLRKISIPVISNVYADKLWQPFWVSGDVGLTTTQNVQIVCFALALVQLSAAHFMSLVRNRKSPKLLGDLGSVIQLVGIFYIVLSLVVNGEVFGFGLVIAGIPVGAVAVALIGVGFTLSFVFSSYEGSIGESVLSSCKNIVSVLLGVVNVFSDIVSYIRLWAVGLAGAAISATVNELAGPFLGKFSLMLVAIVILVFGHGLNMILNVLSVIVHGVRLNTLEFSSHLDMSWSGRKYKPFEE